MALLVQQLWREKNVKIRPREFQDEKKGLMTTKPGGGGS